MSQENVELVRPIYAAWARGDFTSAEWAHPDIEFVVADSFEAGSRTGLAGMAQAWQDWLSAWEEYRVEVDEYRELDDERILVLMLHCGRGKTSGLDVGGMGTKRAGANVLHVRAGRVTRLVLYWDRERALADLGLSEETLSQENVEVVCEALARFSEGDFERTLELIGEDALWEPSGQFVGSGGGYLGHRGIRRFWDAFTEPWEEIQLKPIEATALDAERVLTHTHFRGIGRVSGIPTDMNVVQLWTVMGGKIRRFQSFATRREALEAAGLSEQDAHSSP